MTTLHLLGGFHLTDPSLSDGETIVFEHARVCELIAYVAIKRKQPVRRQPLSFILWPDSPEGQARTNLRNLLFKLRKDWSQSSTTVDIERNELTWIEDGPVTVDVHQFEDALTEAELTDDPAEQERLLHLAITCYTGPLLPELYNDWVLLARDRLQNAYAQALRRLITLFETQRRYDAAIDVGQKLLQTDPVQESTYRLLMQIHATRGDRAAALHTYHECVTVLENELAVEPSALTQDLYTQILKISSAGAPQPSPERQGHQLVGRHQEWQTLNAVWQQAAQGDARLLLISGEAGIGKTRLAEELLDKVRHLGMSTASTRAYAVGGALAYAPVAEWLRQPALWTALQTLEPIWQVEIARLLPELLQRNPALPQPGPLQEGWQRQRFFQALIQALHHADPPLLLHIDDLQWCDEESLNFLAYLLRSDTTGRLLVVATARSEEILPDHPLNKLRWTLAQHDQLVEIELGPLNAAESAELAAHIAGKDLTTELQANLFVESEGHPLFLIETIRAGVEGRSMSTSANEPVLADTGTIPPKIRSVIQARLAQLSPKTLEVAQLAAVIGREFNYLVLRTAGDEDEETLVYAVDELWQRKLLRELGTAAYDFSHDRIREVTYAAISRVRRRFLHSRIAQALVHIHEDGSGEHLRPIAFHWEAAGDDENALHYHSRAGLYAIERFAATEAQEHLRAALRLTPYECGEDRFTLLTQLHDVYAWQALIDERSEILAQMEHLADVLDDDRRRGLCAAHRSAMCSRRGMPALRSSKAQEAIALGERSGALDVMALGYFHWGSALWEVADFSKAAPLLRKAADLAHQAGLPVEEEMALEMLSALGMFTGMSATDISRALNRCWQLVTEAHNVMRQISLCNKFGYLPVAQGEGDYTEARQWYERGLKMARDIQDADMQGQILINMVVLATVEGSYAAGRKTSADYLALPDSGRDAFNHGRYLTYRGSLLLNAGLFAEAQEALDESLARLIKQGSRHFAVKTLVALAWLHHLQGNHQSALAKSEEALKIVDTTGDLRYRATALTYQGYALYCLGNLDAAASTFHQAHNLHQEMAQFNRSMGSLSGLARISIDQGDTEQAQKLVDQICTHLQTHPLDRTIEGCRVYLATYRVLRALNDPRAGMILHTVWDQLQRRAASIDDPVWLRHFWQVTEHAAVHTIATIA